MNVMMNEDLFPTKKLVQNTVSAYLNGYINDEQAQFTLDFAAKLGDTDAQALLEKCKETGVAEAFSCFQQH